MPKDARGTVVKDLACICGNNTVYKSVVDVDGIKVNQLCCAECGIIMRSPPTDKDGKWLENHWRSIHMKKRCWTCAWWENKAICKNPDSKYWGSECSSKFSCDDWWGDIDKSP